LAINHTGPARPGLDPAKVASAARSPRRAGENCGATPGAFAPRVDAARCEGKADCVAVCPYGVFEVARMSDDVFRALPWLARLKALAHGRKTALTPGAEACRACGLCVAACPEQAITLAPAL